MSRLSTPLPINRFDLLFSEQLSLLRSTQDALHQSLDCFHTSTSKDEQESAKLQIQSLIARNDELLTSLKVVFEIKKELEYVQQEIQFGLKNKLNISNHEHRLHWLEQRLEKSFLSRNRRPVARGRRNRPRMEYRLQPGEKKATSNAVDIPESRPSTRFSLMNTPVFTEQTGITSRKSGSVLFTPEGVGESVYSSSKKSASKDSDVWHSESEANWTTVEAPFGVNHSQMLSLVEHGESRDTHSSSQKTDLEAFQISTAVKDFHFEPPRPTEVFGDHSWNSLPLAVNTTIAPLDSGKTLSSSKVCTENSTLVLQCGLFDVLNQLKSLKELVLSAVISSTGAHPNAETKSNLTTKSSPNAKQQTVTMQSDLKLPSLCMPSASVPCPSRKHHGKMLLTYPRSSTCWFQGSVHTKSSDENLCLKIRDQDDAIMRSTKLNDAQDNVDYSYLNTAHYKTEYIKHLFSRLSSSCVQTRIDAIQSLGQLGEAKAEIKQKLFESLLSDEELIVKYESLKSLISLRHIDTTMLNFVVVCFQHGSTSLKVDLIKHLLKFEILKFLPKDCDKSRNLLSATMCWLCKRESIEVAVLVAVLLSHAHMDDLVAIVTLKSSLQKSDFQCQITAVDCLVCVCKVWDSKVLESALMLTHRPPNWKIRLSAVKILKTIAHQVVNKYGETDICNSLLTHIASEPIQVVRFELGELLKEMKIERKALSLLMGRLESEDEMIRMNSVISLGAFNNDSKKIQVIIDCLELDPSPIVQIQSARFLGQLKSYNQNAVKVLLEKSKGTNAVSRACSTALAQLKKGNSSR